MGSRRCQGAASCHELSERKMNAVEWRSDEVGMLLPSKPVRTLRQPIVLVALGLPGSRRRQDGQDEQDASEWAGPGTCQEDCSVWSVTPEAWERLARGAKRPRVHGVFVANPGGVEEFQGGFAPPPGCGFTTRRVVPGCALRTTRGYRLSSLRDDILTLPMTGGGGQDGRDEQDGGWPRGGVEGGPEAPRWESRRYSRRGRGGRLIAGLFPGAPRDSAGDYRDPAQRASRIWMASMCTMPRASSGTNFNGVGTGRRRPRRLGKGPWKATGTLPPVKRVWRDLRRAVE